MMRGLAVAHKLFTRVFSPTTTSLLRAASRHCIRVFSPFCSLAHTHTQTYTHRNSYTRCIRAIGSWLASHSRRFIVRASCVSRRCSNLKCTPTILCVSTRNWRVVKRHWHSRDRDVEVMKLAGSNVPLSLSLSQLSLLFRPFFPAHTVYARHARAPNACWLTRVSLRAALAARAAPGGSHTRDFACGTHLGFSPFDPLPPSILSSMGEWCIQRLDKRKFHLRTRVRLIEREFAAGRGGNCEEDNRFYNSFDRIFMEQVLS